MKKSLEALIFFAVSFFVSSCSQVESWKLEKSAEECFKARKDSLALKYPESAEIYKFERKGKTSIEVVIKSQNDLGNYLPIKISCRIFWDGSFDAEATQSDIVNDLIKAFESVGREAQ